MMRDALRGFDCFEGNQLSGDYFLELCPLACVEVGDQSKLIKLFHQSTD